MREKNGVRRELVIATRNPGKVAELGRLLDGLDLRLLSLDQAGVREELSETGDTFAANAVAKAEQACRLSGRPSLADDSGLCVDALGGAPGVQTARYGGPGLTSEQRVNRLLGALRGIQGPARAAHFECVIALARPDAVTLTTTGTLHGLIAEQPTGRGGFGYDPIFYLPELGATLAELPPAQKDSLSHRGRAVAALRRLLEQHVVRLR